MAATGILLITAMVRDTTTTIRIITGLVRMTMRQVTMNPRRQRLQW